MYLGRYRQAQNGRPALWGEVVAVYLKNLVSAEKKEFARTMRVNPTPPKAMMWEMLRRRRLGYRFHRQAVIRGFIADFWCPALRLVVEVDGKQHDFGYDNRRDTIMRQLGIGVVRVPARLLLQGSECQSAELMVRDAINKQLVCFPGARLRCRRHPGVG
jgi:very-short-patch-repair endonuclease